MLGSWDPRFFKFTILNQPTLLVCYHGISVEWEKHLEVEGSKLKSAKLKLGAKNGKLNMSNGAV